MITKLSHEQLSALRRIDSPTISNAIETFKLRPRVAGYVGYDIRCIFPELPPTVGYAVTCTVDSTTEGRQGIGFQRLYNCWRTPLNQPLWSCRMLARTAFTPAMPVRLCLRA